MTHEQALELRGLRAENAELRAANARMANGIKGLQEYAVGTASIEDAASTLGRCMEDFQAGSKWLAERESGLQSEIRALRAELAQETGTWTDAEGKIWTRPSAQEWAELRLALKALQKIQAHYRWRPIKEIHEDFGPCVLMDLFVPGFLAIGSNIDVDFDEFQWTHFTEVPKLTNEEAEELQAKMLKDPQEPEDAI